MKTLLLFTAAALSIVSFSSCLTSPSKAKDHWSELSIEYRVSRVFLGYEPDEDGTYRDYQYKQKQDINLTIQRHLLNWNPDNPFQPADESRFEPRPNHSPLPDVIPYFHIEAAAFGGIMYATSGAFVPIPVGSIIGTLEPGGGTEFFAGIHSAFGPLRSLVTSFLPANTGAAEDGVQAGMKP